MKAYIICFTLTIVITYISERLLKIGKKKLGIFFLTLSLLTMSVFAGLRSRSVGIDVNNYPSSAYALFVENGYSYIQVLNFMNVEPLFILLVRISTIFENFNVTLFFLELACVLPICIYAYKRKNDCSMTLIIFIFLLTMYAKSFNLIRQFIAISIIILSTYYFENKKYAKTAILFIVAVLFHYSAASCLLIYVILYIVCNMKNKKIGNILIFGILVCLIGFSLGIEIIANFLPEKYSTYINSKYNISNFSYASLLKKVFWLAISAVVLYICRKNKDKAYELQKGYFLLFVIDIIFYLMSLKIGPFGRLGYYFLYVAYFGMIPKLVKVFKQKRVVIVILSIIMIMFWYNMTVVNYQADQVYPYKTDIINFLND